MSARSLTLLSLLSLLVACPDEGPGSVDAGVDVPAVDAGVVVLPDAGAETPEDAGPGPVQILLKWALGPIQIQILLKCVPGPMQILLK